MTERDKEVALAAMSRAREESLAEVMGVMIKVAESQMGLEEISEHGAGMNAAAKNIVEAVTTRIRALSTLPEAKLDRGSI